MSEKKTKIVEVEFKTNKSPVYFEKHTDSFFNIETTSTLIKIISFKNLFIYPIDTIESIETVDLTDEELENIEVI